MSTESSVTALVREVGVPGKRRFAVRLLGLLACSGLPSLAMGQAQRAVIRGTIHRDSAAGPSVEGVSVTIAGIGGRVTSTNGAFFFGDVTPGSYGLAARRPGFRPKDGTIRVGSGDTITLTLVLEPSAEVLPTTTVTGQARAPSIGMGEFETRRAGGLGKFLTTKDFEGRENATLTDVLRSNVPGIFFVIQPGGGFAAAGRHGPPSLSLTPSGRTDLFGSPKPEDQCYMQLWVDGQRIYTYHRPQDNGPNPPKLEQYAVAEILGIEVYRSAAETPVQFNTTGSACGTIVVWTGRPR